jgi:hypothetical protein
METKLDQQETHRRVHNRTTGSNDPANDQVNRILNIRSTARIKRNAAKVLKTKKIFDDRINAIFATA